MRSVLRVQEKGSGSSLVAEEVFSYLFLWGGAVRCVCPLPFLPSFLALSSWLSLSILSRRIVPPYPIPSVKTGRAGTGVRIVGLLCEALLVASCVSLFFVCHVVLAINWS